MSEFDLITFIQNNISQIVSSVELLATGVIGAIYLPRRTKEVTKAQEFEKLRAGLLQDTVEEMVKNHWITYSDLYKIKNYKAIAQKADEYLDSKGVHESIQNQSFEWHARFYENGGNISNEDVQVIWAKILAREIMNPGSCSLRTLDCIKNLSKEEALLFERIARFSYDTGKSVILPVFESVFNQHSITYDELFKLDDCGLLKGESSKIGSFTVGRDYHMITYNRDQAVLAKRQVADGEEAVLEIKEYLFSESGKELYRALEIEADMSVFYEEMKKKYPEIVFCLGKVVGFENEKVIVDDDDPD